MQNKIVAYGELLLRLTPAEVGALIEQSHSLDMGFAGAEANIIADLALLDHQTTFISAFPNNPIGRKAKQFLQGFGVVTDSILLDQGRMGTYYIEHGSTIRGTRVTYDRANSSVCHAVFSEQDWDSILTDSSHFVLTGITPALSQICRDNIAIALRIAKNKNIKVVFDLNYRRKLWTAAEARESFNTILPQVDILMANTGSAHDVFDIQTPAIDGFNSLEAATAKAIQGLENLGDFDMIAMTMRLQSNASQNVLGGMIKHKGTMYNSQALSIQIVDRLGGGDAFSAAVIHGLIHQWTPQEIVNFASAAFAATQTLKGDINYMTEQELEQIAHGNVQGFVKR